ncbi:MAG: AsmA family protein [Candidatus Acidiferrales bacterium]
MRKKILIILGIVLVVLLIAIIAVPFLVDADSFRPTIEQKLSDSLGRKVTLGHLSASLLSGGITAENISIDDDPAFSRSPFLEAKSLEVGVEMRPLIFSRELHVQSLSVRDPEISFLRNSAGKWNFESLQSGTPAASPSPAKPSSANTSPADSSSAQNFSIGQISVTGARVTIGRAGTGVQQVWQNMNLGAKNVSEGSVVPVTFSAKTPGGGAMTLDGDAGPLPSSSESSSFNRLPFKLKLTAKNLPAEDVETLLQILGYPLPVGSKLRGGTINTTLELAGPMEHLVTSGPVSVSNVELTGFSLASKLAAFGSGGTSNTGNSTMIQEMKSNVRVAPDGTRAESISIVVPNIGTVTGNGTVSPQSALNFQMVANLAPGSVLGALSNLVSFAGGSSSGIPFRIGGTSANPTFTPEFKISPGNLGDLAGKLGGSKAGQTAGDLLGGLLKKKKP